MKTVIRIALFVLLSLTASQARAFQLIEIPILIEHLWTYPNHLLVHSPTLINAKKLERFELGETIESVLIYKDPQTVLVDINGAIAPIPSWTFSGALDFASSDWPMGTDPAFFTKPNDLWQAHDFGLGLQYICDRFDIGGASGNPLANQLTYAEVLHNTVASRNVLYWDQVTRKMLISTSPIVDCTFGTDLVFHSDQSSITNATGYPTADITALAEDRSVGNGTFLAFDQVSQNLLIGTEGSSTYAIKISRKALLALTGQTSVDLRDSLTTDFSGNIYAWDRVSQNLLLLKASNDQLYKILSGSRIRQMTGAPAIDIVDIDFLENMNQILPSNAVVLLEKNTGSILLNFRP